MTDLAVRIARPSITPQTSRVLLNRAVHLDASGAIDALGCRDRFYSPIGDGQRGPPWHRALGCFSGFAFFDETNGGLLGGEVAAMFGGNAVAAHIRSGRLRGLAVAGKERSAAYPDLPRLGEFYPGLEANAWLALCGPAGIPEATLSRLRSETRRLLTDPETLQKVRGLGEAEPYISTPEEFAALIRADYAKYGEIVKAVGARID